MIQCPSDPYELDALRERLNKVFANGPLGEPSPEDEVCSATISSDRIQAKVEDYRDAYERLASSLAVPNGTLYLAKRREAGLPVPPTATFGDPGATEDIWATTLCHFGSLARTASGMEFSQCSDKDSDWDRSVRTLLVELADTFLYRRRYWAHSGQELPRVLTRPRINPSLPYWARPIDAVWGWDPAHRLFLPSSLATPNDWLSSIISSLVPVSNDGKLIYARSEGNNAEPIQLHPYDLRASLGDDLEAKGPFLGGKWSLFPLVKDQKGVLGRDELQDMDLIPSPEEDQLPILSNERKLYSWLKRQASRLNNPSTDSNVPLHAYPRSPVAPPTPSRIRRGSLSASPRSSKRAKLGSATSLTLKPTSPLALIPEASAYLASSLPATQLGHHDGAQAVEAPLPLPSGSEPRPAQPQEALRPSSCTPIRQNREKDPVQEENVVASANDKNLVQAAPLEPSSAASLDTLSDVDGHSKNTLHSVNTDTKGIVAIHPASHSPRPLHNEQVDYPTSTLNQLALSFPDHEMEESYPDAPMATAPQPPDVSSQDSSTDPSTSQAISTALQAASFVRTNSNNWSSSSLDRDIDWTMQSLNHLERTEHTIHLDNHHQERQQIQYQEDDVPFSTPQGTPFSRHSER